jgi:hypothetical protein
MSQINRTFCRTITGHFSSFRGTLRPSSAFTPRADLPRQVIGAEKDAESGEHQGRGAVLREITPCNQAAAKSNTGPVNTGEANIFKASGCGPICPILRWPDLSAWPN